MNLLALETSTKHFSLAVARDGRIAAQRSVFLKKVLSTSIIPAIDRILRKAALSLGDLDGFVIGLGPGSFTSLRVGLSTVKALAFVLQKPVVGVSSLDTVMRNVVDQECDQVCVLSDARRGLVYARLYGRKEGKISPLTDHLLIGVDELLDKVMGRTLFAGDALSLYRERIELKYEESARKSKAGCRAVFAPEKAWHPQAQNAVHLAMEKFQSGTLEPLEKILPIYLYPEDCQVQRPA